MQLLKIKIVEVTIRAKFSFLAFGFVLSLSMLLSLASVEAQTKSPIRISIKALPLYEISTAYFPFLEGAKYYDWLYTKEMMELESKVKTKGVVLQNYVFDVSYKSFALLLKVSTSGVSPFSIEGYHIAEDYTIGRRYIVGDLRRSFNNFSVGFKYGWKSLSLHLGYEYISENYASVGIANPNIGWNLFSSGYIIETPTVGGGLKVRLGKNFKISQDLTMSVLGRVYYSIEVQDTAASEQHILYLRKFKEFRGRKVNVLSYTAELGYERNKVEIILSYAYNIAQSRDIFRRAIHRFGVGFMLKLL